MRAGSLFDYSGPVRHLIHEIKYRGNGHALRALISLARPLLPEWTREADAIVPVPLHPERLKERGFNQSLRLASALFPGERIEPFLIRRVVNTRAQTGLGLKERAVNVKEAFSAKGPCTFSRVLLVDDIYTTGATVSACAKAILKAGVSEVYVLTMARA